FDMTTGDCIAFYNNTFHGSFPNLSESNRLVCIVNIVPDDLPTVYYQLNKEEQLTEEYEVTSRLFLENLKVLELGGIPASFKLLSTGPLPAVENESINSADIISRYDEYKKRIPA
ncbi:MAG: hypothetical protein JWO06_1426, partial [Bacteroidota bacterium]|nr:hypothetical protein [Bacteroidota bacterium]